jgi:hypothetical protein
MAMKTDSPIISTIAKRPLRESSIAQGDVVLLGGPAMAYNEGWIKLHRSVRDSVLWKQPPLFTLQSAKGVV